MLCWHVVTHLAWDGPEAVLGAGCQLVAKTSMPNNAIFIPVFLAETAEPLADSASVQAAHVQPAGFTATNDTKVTLQARAQQVQGGNLTSLLMAWFEAGYQTGRHEALSQNS